MGSALSHRRNLSDFQEFLRVQSFKRRWQLHRGKLLQTPQKKTPSHCCLEHLSRAVSCPGNWKVVIEGMKRSDMCVSSSSQPAINRTDPNTSSLLHKLGWANEQWLTKILLEVLEFTRSCQVPGSHTNSVYTTSPQSEGVHGGGRVVYISSDLIL